MAHKPLLQSFGSLTRFACSILLLALTPYTLYAGFQLYRAVFPWTGTNYGLLSYAAARLTACLLLVYALWRLRQAAVSLCRENAPDV